MPFVLKSAAADSAYVPNRVHEAQVRACLETAGVAGVEAAADLARIISEHLAIMERPLSRVSFWTDHTEFATALLRSRS